MYIDCAIERMHNIFLNQQYQDISPQPFWHGNFDSVTLKLIHMICGVMSSKHYNEIMTHKIVEK